MTVSLAAPLPQPRQILLHDAGMTMFLLRTRPCALRFSTQCWLPLQLQLLGSGLIIITHVGPLHRPCRTLLSQSVEGQ